MAGHSQFKNIMHRKGRQDAKRSKLFSKLAREITVAAKLGLPDPTMNARLRLAIQNAKRRDHAEGQHPARHQQGAWRHDAENYRARSATRATARAASRVIVEALTDNRNRTARATCALLSPRPGGALGETGAVSFMLDRVGQIYLPA